MFFGPIPERAGPENGDPAASPGQPVSSLSFRVTGNGCPSGYSTLDFVLKERA